MFNKSYCYCSLTTTSANCANIAFLWDTRKKLSIYKYFSPQKKITHFVHFRWRNCHYLEFKNWNLNWICVGCFPFCNYGSLWKMNSICFLPLVKKEPWNNPRWSYFCRINQCLWLHEYIFREQSRTQRQYIFSIISSSTVAHYGIFNILAYPLLGGAHIRSFYCKSNSIELQGSEIVH